MHKNKSNQQLHKPQKKSASLRVMMTENLQNYQKITYYFPIGNNASSA